MQSSPEQEERALFARLRADRRPEDREAAVARYLPLARGLAARYSHSIEPLEDLEQVAAIGLLKAIDRFDPERGTAFSTFAVPTILGELRRHFRDRTWAIRVPRFLQELALRIEQTRDELTSSLGRQPTLTELSHRLDASEDTVLQALEISMARSTFPLDAPGSRGEEPVDTPGHLESGYARVEDRVMLTTLLARLSRREAQIVFLRFNNDLTQDAIARRIGVSQMHVSRVLYRSLAKLREAADSRPEN